MIRILFVLTLALVLCSAGVHAQETPEVFMPETPAIEMVVPPEIATPPGATLVTEVNLSDADVLGMIKQALPAFSQAAAGTPGEIGDTLRQLDLNSLTDAIAGIKQVRAMQFKLAAGYKPDMILSFYQDMFVPAQGWSRILFDTSMGSKGAIAVYSRGGQEFVGIGVDSTKQRAFAVRTVGFVDVPKLAAWAGKTMKYVSAMQAKAKAARAAKPKPTVKPIAKPKRK